MVTLAQILAYLYQSARPIIDYSVADTGSGQFISYWNAAVLGQQPSQATIDATATDPAFLTWLESHGGDATLTYRRVAKGVINLVEAEKATLRAVAAVATDEINLLRGWIVSFKTQVAASASLADLKTRVASLPNMPDRTLVQFRNAVGAKIDSGAVDT